MKTPGGILVVRGGAIGDFILTLPVLAALRRHLPGNRLEVLAYPRVAELALAGGLVDRVRAIEERGFANFFARGVPPPREQADYFAGFALIISYLYDPDGIFQDNVRQCTGAQFIAGPHRPDEAETVHATEALLKPLERLAIFGADATPRLDLGESSPLTSGASGAALPAENSPLSDAPGSAMSEWEAHPTLAMHPGSGSEKKNWAEKNWTTLIERLLLTTGFNLLIVGGEAERDRLRRLASLASPRVRFAQNLPLTELARRLRAAAAFVGHDSGITHLAAALGLRGLVLWGESKEAVWRPRSERFEVLKAPGGLAALKVEAVAERLRTLL